MSVVRRRSRARSLLDAPVQQPSGVIDLRDVAPLSPPEAAPVKGSKGWLVGGGAIVSPAGSCSRAPSATGTTSFGLAVRRLGDAHAPTGFAALTFEEGNVRFRSSGFDWLLFAGGIATAAGWGTLNGAEGYSFKAMARDVGGGAFRMRIWLSATSAVIYDSEPDVRGDVPSSPVTRGSVVVLAQQPVARLE